MVKAGECFPRNSYEVYSDLYRLALGKVREVRFPLDREHGVVSQSRLRCLLLGKAGDLILPWACLVQVCAEGVLEFGKIRGFGLALGVLSSERIHLFSTD